MSSCTRRRGRFFGYLRLGGVVEVKGTPVQIEATNGFGDWNVEFPPAVL